MVVEEIEDILEDKIRAEAYKLVTGDLSDCEMCFIHGYMRGSESPARLTDIIRQAVELARKTIKGGIHNVTCQEYTCDEIVEVIMRGLTDHETKVSEE